MDSKRPNSEADNNLSSELPLLIETEPRKPQHMAFTIHFDDTNKASTPPLSIHDKVSNYALKHRRNQSLPTAEDTKTTKGEVNSALAVGLSPVSAGKSVASRIAGYHSEGYFSSDQEEDPRNRSSFFVRKLKNLEKGLRTTNLAQEKKNMADQTSQTKLNNSPHMSRHEFGDFHDDEQTLKTRLDELKRLNNASNNVGAFCNSLQDEELSKEEWLMASTVDDLVEAEPEGDLFEDELEVEIDNELSNDTASEAGTYTIERDNTCLEEDQARLEIDRVVAGVAESSEADNDLTICSYRNGTNWINDWATQVAKHNHRQDPEPQVSGLPPLPIDRHKGHSSVTTRIPSPIHGHGPSLPPSGRRNGPASPSRQHLPPVVNEAVFETESYLRDTESLVTAMQARMSLSLDSGGESDVEMNQVVRTAERGRSAGELLQRRSSGGSPRHVSNRTLQSDTSSSEASEVKPKKEESPPPPLARYNRAFSLRRARLDCDPVPTPAAPVVDNRKKKLESIPPSVYKPKKALEQTKSNVQLMVRSNKASSPKPELVKTFSRTDCGRFSVRTPKPLVQSPKTNVAPKKDVKKDVKKTGGRSNSTLSSREVEFQNWKRRKSYDPMKAAAEGKKKDAAKKATFNSCMTQSYITAEELSPSHQNSVLRSASFHGTLGMGGMVPKYPSSEEEVTLSAEEDEESPSNEYEEDNHLAPVDGSPTKSSGDGAIGGSRVSLHSNASNASSKGRTKVEALDSLVMAALGGLSNKLRTRSCILLKKLRYLYEEDIEKSNELSAIIDLLEEQPANPGSPQNKTPSKELSDTLKNMKRLETVINVLDEVLFDDEDFDDLDADTFQ